MSEENIFDLVQDRNTVVIFDGANMYATLRNLEWRMDFVKLKEHFESMCENVSLDYFTAVSANDDFVSVRPLLDLLSYQGYRTITKPTQVIEDGDNKRFKGNVSVNIAIHAMNMMHNGGMKHLVLFAGDSDYAPLVNTLRDHGVRVTVVSSKDAAGDELRRSCNEFIDMTDAQSGMAKFKRTEK